MTRRIAAAAWPLVAEWRMWNETEEDEDGVDKEKHE